jgi:hypothetical protein
VRLFTTTSSLEVRSAIRADATDGATTAEETADIATDSAASGDERVAVNLTAAHATATTSDAADATSGKQTLRLAFCEISTYVYCFDSIPIKGEVHEVADGRFDDDKWFWIGVGVNKAVSPENPNLCVTTDNINHCISIRNVHTDTLVCQYGEQGTGEGQFDTPYGVVITADGAFVLVADSLNHRVQVLRLVVSLDTTTHLEFVRCLGSGTEGTGEGELSQPTWMVMAKDSTTGQHTVVVSEYGNRRSSEFSLDGSFLGYTYRRIAVPYRRAESAEHICI